MRDRSGEEKPHGAGRLVVPFANSELASDRDKRFDAPSRRVRCQPIKMKINKNKNMRLSATRFA